MAEQQERDVTQRSFQDLYRMVKERVNELNNVILRGGRSIGVFTFKKEQESKTRKLYSISMVIGRKRCRLHIR